MAPACRLPDGATSIRRRCIRSPATANWWLGFSSELFRPLAPYDANRIGSDIIQGAPNNGLAGLHACSLAMEARERTGDPIRAISAGAPDRELADEADSSPTPG